MSSFGAGQQIMALMEIVTWPNPILDAPADPVTDFGDGLKKLVSDMFETMYSAPGVGLAAVQSWGCQAAVCDGLLCRQGSRSARRDDQSGSDSR